MSANPAGGSGTNPTTPKEGTAPMTAPKKNTNPFDLKALRESPPVVEVTEKVVGTFLVRKPKSNEFVRTMTGDDSSIDCVLLDFEDDEGNRALYFVPPALRPHVPPEVLKAVRLRVAVNKAGVSFLWPLNLPSGTAGRSWHTSALEAAREAELSWIRVKSNRAASCYEWDRAIGDLGLPVWPTDDLETMLTKAFNERLIDSPDHEILRRLRGEI